MVFLWLLIKINKSPKIYDHSKQIISSHLFRLLSTYFLTVTLNLGGGRILFKNGGI